MLTVLRVVLAVRSATTSILNYQPRNGEPHRVKRPKSRQCCLVAMSSSLPLLPDNVLAELCWACAVWSRMATARRVWGWGIGWVHSSVGILSCCKFRESSFLSLIKKAFLEQHSLASRIGQALVSSPGFPDEAWSQM